MLCGLDKYCKKIADKYDKLYDLFNCGQYIKLFPFVNVSCAVKQLTLRISEV